MTLPLSLDPFLLTLYALLVLILSYFACRYWTKLARTMGHTGKDIHKPNTPNIPESGGIPVLFSVTLALLGVIFYQTYLSVGTGQPLLMFAILTTLLLATTIGFLDDVLGWKKGLKQWQKPILTLPAAIPLMVINAGVSTLSIPFIGSINFGLLYPLVIIPATIVIFTNGINMYAGMNGQESGISLVSLATLLLLTFFVGAKLPFLVTLTLFAALLSFFILNKYPAKLFPGDSLTYPIGAGIAVIGITANLEKFIFILLIPYLFEFFLKLRSRFKAQSFAKRTPSGLIPPYDKIYSLNHIAVKFGKTEPRTVMILIMFQLLFAFIALFLFFVPLI